MLWLSKHARLRNNLSPYIDGRLTASQATALKVRLAGAAVAVVLAVVLVGDLTVGGGGGASREAGSQPAEESRLAQIPGATDTSKSGESGAYAQPSGNADSSTSQSNARAAAP